MLNLPIKILQTQQIETASEAITFSNINTLVAQWDAVAKVTSRHLVLIINAKSVDPGDSITNLLRFNGDAGNNYNFQRLSGVGVVADAGRTDGANAINLPSIPASAGAYANCFGGSMVLIPHAFNTTNHKALLAMGGSVEETVEVVAGRWASVAAITSVTVFEGVGDDFVVGSIIHLGVIDERYLVEEIAGAGGGTFDNIPQGEGDLAIIGYLRTAFAAVDDTVRCAVNDDAVAGNYPSQELIGRAGGPPTAAQVNFEMGIVSAANATPANAFGALGMVISQYVKDNRPHFFSLSGFHQDTGPTGEVRVMSGRRDNIEPINKLYLAGSNFDDFAAGSLLSLYRVPKRLIERQVLTAAQAIITFANIPQNFEALILHVYARSDVAAANDYINLEINNDAGANYELEYLRGAAGAVSALQMSASQWVTVPGNTATAGMYCGGTLLFPAYAKGDRHKHCIVIHAWSDAQVNISSCRWQNVAAITRIELIVPGQNFMAGSVFELEGILRKEGLPPSEGMSMG